MAYVGRSSPRLIAVQADIINNTKASDIVSYTCSGLFVFRGLLKILSEMADTGKTDNKLKILNL